MHIQLIEDPAITELKSICSALSIPAYFLQANLFEANLSLDSLDKTQAPYFVFITPNETLNSVTDSYLLVRKLPIAALLLDVLDSATSEYTTEEVDPYIYRMTQLAQEFVRAINKSAATFKPSPVKEFTINKVYGKFDAHLFGVALSFSWSFNTQHCL